MPNIKFKNFLFILAMGVFLLAPVLVFADDYGLGAAAREADLEGGRLTEIIGNAVGAGLSFIGVLFFILMIYAGVLWMTARGNEEQTKKALNTIIAASIGMVIILASYAITNFVLKSTGGGGGSSNPATPRTDRDEKWWQVLCKCKDDMVFSRNASAETAGAAQNSVNCVQPSLCGQHGGLDSVEVSEIADADADADD